MPLQRVLLVEDFHTFRRAIRTLLEQHTGLQVVGEATDGEEAIQLAAKLLPDLILLDINLPKLNGLQVVPYILELSPCSQIVFLTQEPSVEVAEEALRLGARGYVVKTDAGSELLKALEAIARGERYLSREVSTELRDEELDALGMRTQMVSEDAEAGITGSQGRQTPCAHEAQYYVHDGDFQESLRLWVGRALNAGDSAIVLVTLSHQRALCEALQAEGVPVHEEIRTGRLRLVDADAVVAGYLGDEHPDEARRKEELLLLVESAEKARIGEHSRVCAFGECLSLLYAEGKVDLVLALERLWGELGKAHGLYLRCWYRVSQEQLASDSEFFQKVFEEHTAVHTC
jgi:DNA-binding NarL/FixJ family response regulator